MSQLAYNDRRRPVHKLKASAVYARVQLTISAEPRPFAGRLVLVKVSSSHGQPVHKI